MCRWQKFEEEANTYNKQNNKEKNPNERAMHNKMSWAVFFSSLFPSSYVIALDFTRESLVFLCRKTRFFSVALFHTPHCCSSCAHIPRMLTTIFVHSNFVYCFFFRRLHFQQRSFHVCFFSSHLKTMLCFYAIDFLLCFFFSHFSLANALKLTFSSLDSLLWSAFYVNIQCLQSFCWTFFLSLFRSVWFDQRTTVVAVHGLFCCCCSLSAWSSTTACYSNTFCCVANVLVFFSLFVP